MRELEHMYLVTWQVPEAGAYVPPSPVDRGGDYYATLYRDQLVRASSARRAIAWVREAYPEARRVRVRKLS